MKKTLRLTLLAVAAAFVLTSCDAMLESLFPEQTVGTSKGNNTITFDIAGYDSSWYFGTYVGNWDYNGTFPTYWAQAPIYVEVYDQQNNLVANSNNMVYFSDHNYGASGSGTRYAPSISYSSLPDGNYTFKVWYDYDGDGLPTAEAANTWDYYYTEHDSAYNSNVYISGDTSTTVTVDLYEYYNSY